jgi:hypothetical protein
MDLDAHAGLEKAPPGQLNEAVIARKTLLE